MPAFDQNSVSLLSKCPLDMQTIFYEIVKYFECYIDAVENVSVDEEKHFVRVKASIYESENPTYRDAVYLCGIVSGLNEKLFADGKITRKIVLDNTAPCYFSISV